MLAMLCIRGCYPVQVFLQSGRSPTLLQLLCNLPFEYFSNPRYASPVLPAVVEFVSAETHCPLCRLSALLFPTLISACFLSQENRAILSQEISCQLLVAFLSSHCSQLGTPSTGTTLAYSPEYCVCVLLHHLSHPFLYCMLNMKLYQFLFVCIYRFTEPVTPDLPLPTFQLGTSCGVLLSMTIILFYYVIFCDRLRILSMVGVLRNAVP